MADVDTPLLSQKPGVNVERLKGSVSRVPVPIMPQERFITKVFERDSRQVRKSFRPREEATILRTTLSKKFTGCRASMIQYICGNSIAPYRSDISTVASILRNYAIPR